MQVKVNKKPKSTLEVNITVPKEKVVEAYDELFKQLVSTAEIKGFRKGQAPEDLVKEKTDISKLYGEVVNKLLQTYYPQALKENKILPVANPKVEIKEFDLEKDFEFTAMVATKPEVKVGDYKKEIEKTLDKKNKEIKELNAERLKAGEPIDNEHAHLNADDVIEGLVSATKVELSDIVIDDETDRLMSRLIQQAQSIGMSLEDFLKTQNKTAEDLRNDYKEIAERNLTAEFAMSEMIHDQKLDISDEEVNAMVQAAGSDEGREELNSYENRLYIRSILLKNKLISNIIKEVEGDPHAEEKGNDESQDTDENKEEK